MDGTRVAEQRSEIEAWQEPRRSVMPVLVQTAVTVVALAGLWLWAGDAWSEDSGDVVQPAPLAVQEAVPREAPVPFAGPPEVPEPAPPTFLLVATEEEALRAQRIVALAGAEQMSAQLFYAGDLYIRWVGSPEAEIATTGEIWLVEEYWAQLGMTVGVVDLRGD